MKKYLSLIILLFIVSIPNVLFVVFGDESTTSTLFKKIGFLFLSGAYIALPLSLIKPKYYLGILTFFIPFAFLDIFLILIHHNQSTVTHYLTVLATNRGESIELMGDFRIHFFSFFMLFVTYIYYLTRLVKQDYSLPKRVKRLIFIASISIIGVIGVRDISNAVKYHGGLRELTFSKVYSVANELIVTKIKKSFPLGVIVKVNKSFLEYKKLDNLLNGNVVDYTLKEFNDSLKIDNVVLIIGESARRQSFGIYGYKRATSPLLSKTKNLIAFDSVTTTSNITILSLIQALSSVTVKYFDKAYEEKGIYSAFNLAGFKTRLISRQPYNYSSYINSISLKANQYDFISGDLEKSNSYDQEVLGVMDDGILVVKNFMVIHTMGSHMRYNLRYPKEFEKFTPTINDNEGRFTFNTEMKLRLVNAYDNSIVYTDFIISKIISQIESKGKSSVVIYFSDHGENLFDDDRNIIGHSKKIPTKYSTNIPLFIWYSDKYYDANKELINNLKFNQHSKVTTEIIFHTLCSLGGFKTNLHNDNYDLTSSKKLSYERMFYAVDKKIIYTDSILEIENKIKPYSE